MGAETTGWQRSLSCARLGVEHILLRLHVFHLLQTVSPHSVDLDVGVPALQLFTEAAMSDLLDVQGETTAEGIHLGAMAGTLDFIQRGVLGVVTLGHMLEFNPRLPDALNRLRVRLRYRGQSLRVELRRGMLRVTALGADAPPNQIAFMGHVYPLSGGGRLRLELG